MKTGVFTVSIWMFYGFTAALLLCSLLFCFRSWNPRYLRLFPFYIGANLIMILWPQHPSNQETINIIGVVIEQGYFSAFLYVLFRPGRTRTALAISNVAYVFIIAVLLWRFGRPGVSLVCGLLESLVLIPFCLLWFRQVFRYPIYERLVDQPSYWFVTGILFYISVQLPALVFTSHAVKHKEFEMAYELFSANYYALAISYMLFGIGIAWRSSPRCQRRLRADKKMVSERMITR